MYCVVWFSTVFLTEPSGGVDYEKIFDDLPTSKPFVYALIASSVFGIVVATGMRWWRDVLVEPLRLRGWLRWMPVLFRRETGSSSRRR